MTPLHFPHLFEPIRIGETVIGNRIVMPPMSTNFADPRRPGEVSERHLRYYAERAKGGAGLIIVESTSINPKAAMRRYGLSLHGDAFVPGMRELVGEITRHGAACGIQLIHGGRVGPMKTSGDGSYTAASSAPVYAASSLPHPRTGIPTKELDAGQIEEIAGCFATAASRARAAGFDCVEIHGAHGYLLNEFLSPATNKRKDRFGGDLEGRSAFPLEVVRRVKDALGHKVLLSYRVSAVEYVDGGLDLEDVVAFARRLEKEGVDVLHVSAGLNDTLAAMNRVIPPMSYPRGTLVKVVRLIRDAIRIPVIAVQRINTPELAERILAEGGADLVATGRGLIADPHWPMKARQGRAEEIRRCIACNQGCMERVVLEESLTCLCNPEVGEEGIVRPLPGKKKRIAVLGGGVAGMEASSVLAERGHVVTLIEKRGFLGGNAAIGSIPTPKAEFRGVVDSLERRLKKLNVSIALNREGLEGERFDEIVVATGARPRLPSVGFAREAFPVLLATEVLETGGEGIGARVVVIGGGSVGIEVAEYLRDKGRDVTVIEMLDRICGDLGPLNRANLLERIEGSGIRVHVDTKVLRIDEEGILIRRKGTEELLSPPDVVVVAMGSVAAEPEVGRHLSGTPVHYIGDCKRPGNAMDAIHDAYRLALTL